MAEIAFSLHGKARRLGAISSRVRVADLLGNSPKRPAMEWNDSSNYGSLPSSTPPIPRRPGAPVPKWLAGIQIPARIPSSPAFSFVSTNPSFYNNASGAGSSKMWTRSRVSSPVVLGAPGGGVDAEMHEVGSDELAFWSRSSGNAAVNHWEGETSTMGDAA